MIQGTTAQFKFDLPCDIADLQSAKVVFWQYGYDGPSATRPLPIYKILEQCSTKESPCELYVCLTPEETSRFSDKQKAYVQLHATTKDGFRYGTIRQEVPVYPAYDNEPIGDIVVPTPDYDGLTILDGMNIADEEA